MVIPLREQKKRAVREELSIATVLLARERGLGNVRVDDIVDRVGVSRRTFGNYFSSKEEAIADRHVQRARAAAEALVARPPEEPLWAAVTEALLMPYTEMPDSTAAPSREQQSGLLAVLADPALQSAVDRGARTATTLFAAAAAKRLRVSPDDDFRPRLVANTALSTLLLTLEFWVGSGEPAELLPMLRRGFDRLGAGLGGLG